ncbi:MAG: HAMP domain-containing protein [Alphaproteobacteria bacterium]|nr:HAMP domain-containing protein [Alphaproteobacteria bacterium]MBV9371681.1 HAMP domain-containing protein [Alphaproteobacteria bacterium]MBV9902457.1 HAMP domain-containing protein [Alphaproteobacteria bacterium]
MTRFLPKSLLGQMLLLMGAALLVAQLVNLTFILNEQQKLALAQNEGPAIVRFAQTAAPVAGAPPAERARLLDARRGGRGAAYRLDPASYVGHAGARRSREIEAHLAAALAELRVPHRAVEGAAQTEFGPVPPPPGRRRPLHTVHDYRKVLLLSVQLDDGRWLNGRLLAPRADPWLIHQILLATSILFLIVFGAVIWIGRRIARPLRDLAAAAEAFGGRTRPEPVEPRGPADVRRAIDAFNAMNRRTVALLDEKDRMLGALGHDLRTPLASIRIRAESLEPEEERERMIATVEEMHAMLEDILVLARTGRAREPVRAVDLGALADTVAEEYREVGRPVLFRPSPRAVLEVQPNLLRRALRNLVDNALAYAGNASLRVEQDEAEVRLIVEDEGPGIPEERMDEVLEPFRRLEESRSRESGGAGLGLAIVQAAALSHGGTLRLSNRPGGGLQAAVVLPRKWGQ